MLKMKRVVVFVLCICLFSCSQTKNNNISGERFDNIELEQLYLEDQFDRKGEINWQIVSENDRKRRIRVQELLDSNKVLTSIDYYHSAMIFQHGSDTIASAITVKLMQKSIELDPATDKWLLAAAIDRDLMRRNLPQIYGTQFIKMSPEAPWQLYKLDSAKITDKERESYGVEPLNKLKEKAISLNKKKLELLIIEGRKIDEIIGLIVNGSALLSSYNTTERGINGLGYSLLKQENYEDAVKVFELNTALNPDSYNAFDSYGECLLKMGWIEKAATEYEISLKLNPENINAMNALAEIAVKIQNKRMNGNQQ